mmetsp:Transcript_84730/g.140213  ORF Transcript_84730/g.140213 Transcript_84730/m.140213 type:complete len:103 (+) Transcript_84730:3-311(+)
MMMAVSGVLHVLRIISLKRSETPMQLQRLPPSAAPTDRPRMTRPRAPAAGADEECTWRALAAAAADKTEAAAALCAAASIRESPARAPKPSVERPLSKPAVL